MGIPEWWTNSPKLADIINIYVIPKTVNSEELAHFYHEERLTCTQIAAKVGVSKQLVLRRLGKLQPNNKMNGRDPENYRYWKNPPYGTKVVKGKLKLNSDEMKVVRWILEFKNENKWSWRAISNYLNKSGIMNRIGELWQPTSIRSIYLKNS